MANETPSTQQAPGLTVIFDDPRLKMTYVGRFFVRVVSYIAYLFFIAATITFIISGILWLFFAGLFLLLFFIDTFVHRGEADVPIAELPKSGTVNAAASMLPDAFSLMERSLDHAMLTKQDFFLEVAERIANVSYVEEGLRRLDVKPDEFKQKLGELLAERKGEGVPTTKADCLKKVEALAIAAFGSAVAQGHNFVKVSDLFSALAKVQDEGVSRLFTLFSINAEDLELALILSSAAHSRLPSVLGGFTFETHHDVRHRVMNRAWTSRPTPTLDRYGTDFTDLARDAQAGFLIGHTEEYQKMVETLARPINPNVLLVGEEGIGKETIVKHFAFRLVKDDVPRALFDKRLVALEIESVCAGASPEELDARLKNIVREIDMAGNVILYIPDVHNLVRTSGTAYLSAADILMPVVKDNRFPFLGATYPREFKQFIEPRSDFVGAFEVVPVNEVAPAEAERVLAYESLILERKTRIVISFGAIKRAVGIAKKYLRDKFLPSSAEEAPEERGRCRRAARRTDAHGRPCLLGRRGKDAHTAPRGRGRRSGAVAQSGKDGP